MLNQFRGVGGYRKPQIVFMYYFQGNNNISRDTIYKAARLETVGSDPNVTAVVLLSEPEASKYPGVTVFKVQKRYDIPSENDPTIISRPLYTDRHADAADPQTLKKFLIYTMKRFPAKRYVLVMMDHGFGFLGGMDNSKGKYMDIRDMARVLREVKRETGKGVDVLGFDACMMAQEEVLTEFKGTVKYIVASEDIEYPYGWMEAEILKELQNRASKYHKLTAREIAEIMYEVNSEHPESMKTVSLLNVDASSRLAEALDALAERLMELPKEDLRELISSAPYMCHLFPDDKLCTNYRDLKGLLKIIKGYAYEKHDKRLLKLVRNCETVLSEVVLKATNSGEQFYKDAMGLSVYLSPEGPLTEYVRSYEKRVLSNSVNHQNLTVYQNSDERATLVNPEKILEGLRFAILAPKWLKMFRSLQD